jgi:hypothetical protein
MKAAKTIVALSLLQSNHANAASKQSSERRWETVKEKYTRSMDNSLSAAKASVQSDPGRAVQELRKYYKAYHSGPNTHHKGISKNERESFKRQKDEAYRLMKEAKMTRGAKKRERLNREGKGKSKKAQTIRNRSQRKYGYR